MKISTQCGLSRVAASVAAVGVALLTGCAGFNGTAPSSLTTYSTAAVISGNAHGGQQPIYNAVVRLYSGGTTGYGQGSTLLATSANTDTGGGFAFTKSGTNSNTVNGASSTWACPTSGDPIIYLTAIGGNTQGTGTTATNNAASGLMAVLGPCSTVSSSTHVIMNEITTVASALALAPYINPGTTAGSETVGTSSTAQGSVGLKNAAATMTNLVNNDLGAVPVSSQYQGSGTAAGITVTATPEASKLTTMANILASCINSVDNTSANCGDLFSSAQSASGTSPVDTIQAAYYMATNPINAGTFTSCNNGGTTKTGCLFGLAAANSPFQPNLSAAPLDWTVGVTFTAAGTCSGAGGGGLAAGGSFINGTFKSAVDASGNIWFIGGATNGNNIAEMSPVGAPLMCFGNSLTGRGMTIDPAGNVWGSFNSASNLATDIQELPAGSSTPIAWPVTGSTPYGLVSDGQGNVFYSFLASGGGFNEFISPGATTTPFPPLNVATGLNGTTSTTIASIAADSSNRIWSSTSTTPLVFGVIPGATQTPVAITGYQVASNVVTFLAPNTLTAGTTVTIAGLSSGSFLNGQSLPVLASPAPNAAFFSVAFTHADAGLVTDPGTATPATPYTSGSAASKQNNYGMAIDASNYLYSGTSCCNSTNYHLIEKFTPNSTPSAVTYTATAGYLGGINGVRTVAVDGAGNLWVGNAYSATGSATTTTNFAISEISGSTLLGLSPPTTLSPIVTSTGGNCTTSGCPTGGGFIKNDLAQVREISIDLSGNVWAFNYGIESALGTSTSIVEIVGAGTPVVQPLSLAAKNGTIATRP